MITVDAVYLLVGAMFAAFAALSGRDGGNRKRWGNAAFWGLLAVSFLFGRWLGDLGNGVLVLGLVALAGTGRLGRGAPATTSAEQRRERAERRGDLLFLPALIIPATALLGTLLLKGATWGGAHIVDPKQVTLISLGAGVVIALGVAMLWLRPPPLAPLQEGRRLIDAVGWAAVLPQMLASLGAVFLLAEVGEAVGGAATAFLPLDTPFLAVAAYGLGMALFTMIMGNAFAAFPVMTAAIGLPLIVGRFEGDPAVMGAIGMLSGFCGTLMTPMAANFNVVPATLLDLPDRDKPLNGVIRAQIPTALPLLAANIALMALLVYR
ncbi:MAG TPA: DUF979 domain-containing protein [Caulobacteraceae bacterium]|jgi:uncharacterized membrane protein